jgi:diguanylate cyclase (GGDEF)-like protein
MIFWLSAFLVLAGLTLHVATLVPLRKLMAMLPAGALRNKWIAMAGLIFIFITGYLGYLVVFWGEQAAWNDLLIPGIFFFGAVFVRLAIVLALQTAVDLRRINLLETENVTDPLTKVYNRRYLDKRLAEEVARSKRYALDLSVLMLDIDYFKRVNDTYGHQAGDVTLATLAGLVRTSLRELDVVARYGGEEFMVICTNTPVNGAVMVAERLRRVIESQPMEIPGSASGNQIVRISISIGVASLNADIDSQEKLVLAADEALYRAKAEGRNRVVAHGSGMA